MNRLFDEKTCKLITERVLTEINHNQHSNLNSNQFQSSIQALKNSYRTPRTNRTSSKSPRAEKFSKFLNNSHSISYSAFVNVVLTFQLEQHSKMIETITKCFKQSDTNLDGSIDRIQLIMLVEKLQITDNDIIDSIVSELDPNELDFITYSQFLNFSFNSNIPFAVEGCDKPKYISLAEIAEDIYKKNTPK